MLSRRGVRRPWVNFEAGAAWLAGKPLIPVCYGKMTIDTLPRPYSNFHAVELPAKLDFLVESVAKHMGLPKPRSSVFDFLNQPKKDGILETLETITSVRFGCRCFRMSDAQSR